LFERNILTFNPGWDDQAQAVEEFTDVREHQRRLKSKGLNPRRRRLTVSPSLRVRAG
jgi:hypothetical protein